MKKIDKQYKQNLSRTSEFYYQRILASNYKNLPLIYGLHLPVKRGYREQSLTVYLLHNHAKIRSVPKP